MDEFDCIQFCILDDFNHNDFNTSFCYFYPNLNVQEEKSRTNVIKDRKEGV